MDFLRTLRRLALLFAFAAGVFALPARAQSSAADPSPPPALEPAAKSTPPASASPVPPAPPPGPVPDVLPPDLVAPSRGFAFNITVKDGVIWENGHPLAKATVANVIAYASRRLRAAELACAPGIANLTVGDLDLHNAWPHAFSLALVTATNNQIVFHNSSQSWTYALRKTQPPAQVAVYNLSPYLKSTGADTPEMAATKVESLSGFIRKAVQQANGETAAQSLQFEFHQGSGVFAVIAPADVLPAVASLMAGLQPQPNPAQEIQIATKNLERLVDSLADSQSIHDPAMQKMLQQQLQEQLDTLTRLIHSLPQPPAPTPPAPAPAGPVVQEPVLPSAPPASVSP